MQEIYDQILKMENDISKSMYIPEDCFKKENIETATEISYQSRIINQFLLKISDFFNELVYSNIPKEKVDKLREELSAPVTEEKIKKAEKLLEENGISLKSTSVSDGATEYWVISKFSGEKIKGIRVSFPTIEYLTPFTNKESP